MADTQAGLYRDRWRDVSGTRTVVAAFGILCGLTGIIAGIFEMRQGHVVPEGFVISTIGPEYAMADDFTYFAVTMVPDLMVTGIIAILVSSIVMVWAAGFVQRKRGVWIMLGLFVIQTLVGGGWIVDLAAITCILALGINKPLRWWRTHLPIKLQAWLTGLLPVSLAAFTVISLGMLVLTVTGADNPGMKQPMELLAALMFIPMVLMIFGSLAHDVRRKEIAG